MSTIRKIITRALALSIGLGSAAASAGTIKPSPDAAKVAGDHFDFEAWDHLLKKYVDDKGRVDYVRLKATAEDAQALDKLYAQVAAQKLDALPSVGAKKAFLIDAYNVCVWVNVLSRLPAMKDLDGKLKQYSFFYTTDFIVAGKTVNLKKLEDDEVRERFKDPRVHMALNCASGGCPQLPAEAFAPGKIDAQLDREAKKFVNEPRNVSFDAAAKSVKLSKIFDWYDKDFDKKQIAWLNRYRAADQQVPPDAKVTFVDYDWRLNDRSLPR